MGSFEGASNFTVNNGKFLDVGKDYVENNNSRQVRNVNSNNTTIEYSVNSHNNSSRRVNRTYYNPAATANRQFDQRNMQTNGRAYPQGPLNMRKMDEAEMYAFRQQMNILRMEGRAGSDSESSDEDQEEFDASVRAHQSQPQLRNQLPEAGITQQPTLPHSQSEPLPTQREFKSNNPFVKLIKSQGSKARSQPEAKKAESTEQGGSSD